MNAVDDERRYEPCVGKTILSGHALMKHFAA